MRIDPSSLRSGTATLGEAIPLLRVKPKQHGDDLIENDVILFWGMSGGLSPEERCLEDSSGESSAIPEIRKPGYQKCRRNEMRNIDQNNDKKKICQLPKRMRKQITLTIDPDHHAFIRNTGMNASRFFDSAISALRSNTEHKTILIALNLGLESEKKAGLKGFEPLTDGLRVRRYS